MEQIREFGLRSLAVFVSSNCLDQIRGPGGDVFLHAKRAIEFELLRQIPHAQCPPHGDLAGVGGLRSGEDFQQRGLAAAVAAHQSHLLAGCNRQRDPVKQSLIAVAEPDAGGG